MGIKEINSGDWSRFFELFSQMERDTLVNIDQTDPTGVSRSIAKAAPLREIKFDGSGSCNNVIRISTGGGETPHQIIEPIHVKIRQDANDRKILQIDAESGETVIAFHSGRLEGLLRALEQKTPAGQLLTPGPG